MVLFSFLEVSQSIHLCLIDSHQCVNASMYHYIQMYESKIQIYDVEVLKWLLLELFNGGPLFS